MDEARKGRIDLLSRFDFAALRKTRNDAAANGNLSLADDANAAINLRSRSQNSEIEHCGELFEHVEQPSIANGGRFITRYTGDCTAWMAPFMTRGVVCQFDRDFLNACNREDARLRDIAQNGEPVTVRVREGEQAVVLKPGQRIVSG